MVNIKLVEGWRLLTDTNNWIIAREDGERVFHEGFYSTLENAIKGFVAMKIRGFDSTSLLGLNNSIKSLEKAFYKSIQEAGVREVNKDGD